MRSLVALHRQSSPHPSPSRSLYQTVPKVISVGAPKLAAVWWMRPFGLDDWWRRGGGVDMKFDNFDRLLERGERVIYYPEGVPGIGKGFLRRYQLQHFYSSFVVLAARHHAPVCPVSVVNAEWVNPTSVTFRPLDRFFYKVFGLPFFPIPIVFLVLVFPFLFYLAFPCHMIFLIGTPLDVRALVREAGGDPDDLTREVVLDVAERIRAMAQERLDRAVEQYGDRPYALKTLWRELKSIRGRIFRTTPLGWPFSFIQHDRDLHRPPARNRLHAALRDLDILAWYLPLGWFLIALLRAIRRPPYGYRGLSEQERREKEGAYLWLLDRRPLPEKRERTERRDDEATASGGA